MAKLAANYWHNKIFDIAGNIYNKVKINFTNIDLPEFNIYVKILLAKNIRKTCCRWVIKDYTNNNKINSIIILIIKLRTKILTNKKDSIFLYYCQVTKINSPNKSIINNINKDIIALWQKIIYQGRYFIDKKINIDNIDNLYQII